jgi:hypothetical protein
MATQEKEDLKESTVDLKALAEKIAAKEAEEAKILEAAAKVREAQQARRQELASAAEPIISKFRPELDAVREALGVLSVNHKEQMDELRARHEDEKKELNAQLESILVALEAEGVPREQVLPKKGSSGATGKRGPGLKAEALGAVGSADKPISVTAPRRRVGDGVPETHEYYCDGTVFCGRMKDGSWSQSARLSEVSSSHGWHDTKDVAAALLFAAGKPVPLYPHPGAVFSNGTMVPTGANTGSDESETV